MFIAILCFISIALQVLDYWTTVQAIESGKGTEANKLVNWFMDKLGLRAGLALLKAVGIIISLVIYYSGYWIGFIPLIALYGYVVRNNYKIFKS
jgi:hypothetical protein